jgi:hypothetical protein
MRVAVWCALLSYAWAAYSLADGSADHVARAIELDMDGDLVGAIASFRAAVSFAPTADNFRNLAQALVDEANPSNAADEAEATELVIQADSLDASTARSPATLDDAPYTGSAAAPASPSSASAGTCSDPSGSQCVEPSSAEVAPKNEATYQLSADDPAFSADHFFFFNVQVRVPWHSSPKRTRLKPGAC